MARRAEPKREQLQQMIVRVPRSMHAAVKAQAVAEERTMSQTVRRALKLYLAHEVDG